MSCFSLSSTLITVLVLQQVVKRKCFFDRIFTEQSINSPRWLHPQVFFQQFIVLVLFGFEHALNGLYLQKFIIICEPTKIHTAAPIPQNNTDSKATTEKRAAKKMSLSKVSESSIKYTMNTTPSTKTCTEKWRHSGRMSYTNSESVDES